jgi:hypothetical protein
MRLKSALKRLCKLLPMPQPLEELMRSDDDDGGAEPVAPSLAPKLPRPRGATNALQHFAGEPTGEGEDAPKPDPKPDPELEPEPETDKTSQTYIDTAYERGRQAKADGHKRTAIPGEYREADRGKEAIAWRRGWDGDPPPVGGGHV